jgi:hypothetical protein
MAEKWRPSPLQTLGETAKLPQNLVAIDEKNLRRWICVAENHDVPAGEPESQTGT